MANSTPIAPAENSNLKSSFPKYSLFVSVSLWLLAWAAIVWLVPVQPRAAFRIPSNDGLDPEISERLAGFSPDGKMAVTAIKRIDALNGQIHLWDAETGKDLGIVGKEGTSLLPNVVYCSQHNFLDESGFSDLFDSAVDRQRNAILYDLIDGKQIIPIAIGLGQDNGTCLCFSPDGRTLAYSTYSQDKGEFKLIEVKTGQVRVHLEGGKYGEESGLAFSDDSHWFVTAETKTIAKADFREEYKLIVANSVTGECRSLLLENGEGARNLVISPDGKKLAAYFHGENPKWNDIDIKKVTVWDLSSGMRMWDFGPAGFPEFLEDGKALALWHREGISFCHAETGRVSAEADKYPVAFMGVLSHPPVPVPGTHLLAVKTFQYSKPNYLFQWCANYLGMKSLAEERYVAELSFLDTRTGKTVATIVRPGIHEVKIFPDGTKLALTTIKDDQSIIEIWDILPRRPLGWILGLLAIPSAVTMFTVWRWRKVRR